MLQKQTVSKELFELLENLMKSELFSDFRLVGGTALALQIGHRNSVDIDMFAHQEIDVESFIEELQTFGELQVISSGKNIFICIVNGVKIDFVNHIYSFLDEPLVVDEIRLATKKDIAAMKLNAIEQRGTRKDFVDLYFLLDYFSIEEMVDFYRQKYPHQIPFMMLQSINYFREAELTPMPIIFKDFNWEECKEMIREEHKKLKI